MHPLGCGGRCLLLLWLLLLVLLLVLLLLLLLLLLLVLLLLLLLLLLLWRILGRRAELDEVSHAHSIELGLNQLVNGRHHGLGRRGVLGLLLLLPLL